jgi:hypothetical protein
MRKEREALLKLFVQRRFRYCTLSGLIVNNTKMEGGRGHKTKKIGIIPNLLLHPLLLLLTYLGPYLRRILP